MRLIREEKTFIREAVLLMLPMILQNFVTFSMSMADTFMVGVLGETALAAVTMANSPFYVMQLMIFGVQSGMSVLVAQYHGRGDQEAINRVMGIALFVSTTITGLLAITAFCIPEQIMRVLTNNADLVAPGAAYTRYVGFSYFFSAISGVYIAAQRSTENPRLGAVLLTVSGALNIFLNWVLIYGKLGAPMLGCAGAAVATLISRAFEVAVLCVYAAVSRRLPAHAARTAAPRPRDRKGLRQIRPARRVQRVPVVARVFALHGHHGAYGGQHAHPLGLHHRRESAAHDDPGVVRRGRRGRRAHRAGDRPRQPRQRAAQGVGARRSGARRRIRVHGASSRSCAMCCCGRTSCR